MDTGGFVAIVTLVALVVVTWNIYLVYKERRNKQILYQEGHNHREHSLCTDAANHDGNTVCESEVDDEEDEEKGNMEPSRPEQEGEENNGRQQDECPTDTVPR